LCKIAGMKVRLALETDRLPASTAGLGISACGGLSLLLAARRWNARLAVGGVIALLLGRRLRRSRGLLLAHPKEAALDRAARTLALASIRYERSGMQLLVVSTWTVIMATGWGRFSVLAFDLRDPNSKREQYLATMIAQLQRGIG